ncbi:MAG: class I SAM-dependent methyltransferase [Chloroflexi bacterium]|nr:class I SAM-dependent methyltransferase [Chloroflexota bacterium]
MVDAPLRLTDPDLRARLQRALDPDGRVAAAIATLGPVADRDVVCLEPAGGDGAQRLLSLGAWVRALPVDALAVVPDARADVIVSWWSAFRPGAAELTTQLAEAVRVLRPDGRLLVIHDYARDDVARLTDAPRAEELIAWSRPKGPLLGVGFRIRVLHCWWQWPDLAEAASFLGAAYGAVGAEVAAGLRRPRLAYKVALYHADRATLVSLLGAQPAVEVAARLPVAASASTVAGPTARRPDGGDATPAGTLIMPPGGMVFA